MFRTTLYSNEYFISTISCRWSLPIPLRMFQNTSGFLMLPEGIERQQLTRVNGKKSKKIL